MEDEVDEEDLFFRNLRRSNKTINRQVWRNQLKDTITIRRKKLVWKVEDTGYICNGSFCFSGRCHGCEREKTGKWVRGDEVEEITKLDPVWSPDLHWKRFEKEQKRGNALQEINFLEHQLQVHSKKKKDQKTKEEIKKLSEKIKELNDWLEDPKTERYVSYKHNGIQNKFLAQKD